LRHISPVRAAHRRLTRHNVPCADSDDNDTAAVPVVCLNAEPTEREDEEPLDFGRAPRDQRGIVGRPLLGRRRFVALRKRWITSIVKHSVPVLDNPSRHRPFLVHRVRWRKATLLWLGTNHHRCHGVTSPSRPTGSAAHWWLPYDACAAHAISGKH